MKLKKKAKCIFLTEKAEVAQSCILPVENIIGKVEVIDYDTFCNTETIEEEPTVLIVCLEHGIFDENRWEWTAELSCRAQNLFTDSYAIIVAPDVSPYYLTRLNQLNFQEYIPLQKSSDFLPQRLSKLLELKTLPVRENYIRVSNSILKICRSIESTFDLDKLLKTIISKASKEFASPRCSILLIDGEGKELTLAAAKGLPKEIMQNKYIPPPNSIVRWVIEHNKPLILNDKVRDRRFRSIISDPNVKSAMCAPLVTRGKIIGVMNITRTKTSHRSFTDGDLRSLMVIASTAAFAIDNIRLIEQLLKNERFTTIGITLAGVAHCIKNILTTFVGGISLLDKNIQNSSFTSTAKICEMLKSSSARLQILVMNMLDYSKKRQPTYTEFMVKQLRKELTDNIDLIARRANVEINWSVEPEAEIIKGDYDRLFRALMNLGINAIEAMPNGGNLYFIIRTMTPAELAKFTPKDSETHKGAAVIVRDTGVGIPKNIMARLFEPLLSTKGSKGTGLGLLTTKQFIEDHEGLLEVSSEEGKGTTFTLLLPYSL